jgi:transporter family-2 protein
VEPFILGLALVAGGLLAVQAAANLQLSSAVGGPIAASPVQLGIAATLLVIVAAGAGTLTAATGLGGVPAWHLLGGLASPLYITAGMLLLPRLGALTSMGLFIAGQLTASLAIDGLGLFGVPRADLGLGSLIGALAVVGGTAAIVRARPAPAPAPALAPAPNPVSAPVPAPAPTTAAVVGTSPTAVSPGRPGDATDRGATNGSATGGGPARGGPARGGSARGGGSAARGGSYVQGVRGRPWWVALGLIAGGGLPVQAAINARLRAELHAPFTAAAVSFVVATATAATLLLVLIVVRRARPPRLDRTPAMPWWGWLGGLAAAVYVTVSLLAIPIIGAAATVAVTVAGEQAASAAADHYGLLRLRRRPVRSARLLGVLALLAGAALIKFT